MRVLSIFVPSYISTAVALAREHKAAATPVTPTRQGLDKSRRLGGVAEHTDDKAAPMQRPSRKQDQFQFDFELSSLFLSLFLECLLISSF
jgi:hypothetical protein